MKLWWLLLTQYSYLPVPRRWQADSAELPRALFLLPLWGVASGLLLVLAARYTWILGTSWQAALLLGVGILLNGSIWLRDVMTLAIGHAAAWQPVERGGHAAPPAPPPFFGRAALLLGGVYLLLYYTCLLVWLRLRLPLMLPVAAQAVSRWVYIWGVYDFAAIRPAFLHCGMDKRSFGRASAISLLVLAACAYFAPVLWPALAVAAVSALLLYRTRRRFLGALDEAAYGAAAAVSELALYLSAPILGMWLF